MRSGAMLGGGGRRLTAPSSSSSSSVVNAALPSSAPSPHAPAGRGFAPPRASASRSARVVAAAGHAFSVGAALRARGSSLPAALLRAGRGAPATTSSAPRRRSSPPSSLVVRAVFERFTERAIKAVMLSQTEAKTLGSSDVCTEHLLLGLICEETGSSANKAGYLGFAPLTLEAVRAAAAEALGASGLGSSSAAASGGSDVKPTELAFSGPSKRTFEAAAAQSRSLGMNYVSPEHVLSALLSSPAPTPAGSGGAGAARSLVAALGVDPDALKQRALNKLRGDAEGSSSSPSSPGGGRARAAAGGGGGGKAGSSGEGAKVLAELTRDLCEEARRDRTDPVIGREKEVTRVVQILARRSKNNPILLGDPGVGKTAIAEGLATAIVTGALPDGSPLPSFLEGKRVLSLDLGLVLAGAKERGELESRITKMLAEIDACGDVILMIDEIHSLVGAGSAGGRGGGGGGAGMDIANLLKPPLARGGLQCIGATTLDEFRKHIERDPALERRFQPVIVGEPSEPEALEILQGLASRYERHHRCVYDADALAAAVSLSARYVPDRQLPDKAIDVMDEAGSRARIDAYLARKAAAEHELEKRGKGGRSSSSSSSSKSSASSSSSSLPSSAELNGDVEAFEALADVMEARAAALSSGDYEAAASLLEREAALRALHVGEAADCAAIPRVSRRDVERVVAQWSRVPVEAMAPDEKARILALAPALGERVIGQSSAVAAVSRAMLRARSGLSSPDRPIAGMLFAGPTGVGKTELTRALADVYFGSADAIVRLDMSEYMERHTVAKLVGPPPGYVGYGEGGKLTEAVRRKPHCVVLLDEVEKAHPDVFNVLLQVLEDGRLTDSEGRTVSFKNVLLVMTSNIGSSVISKGGRGGIGFDLGGVDGESAEDRAYGRVRSLVLEELKGYFRPELLNRLDEVVVFRNLEAPDARKIAALELAKTGGRLVEQRGIHLEVTERLMGRICAEGYDREYGARPLKRAITALVDDPLSDALLSGALEEGDVARLDDVSGEPEGSYSKVPGAVVGAAGVVCTSVKPGQAKRRGGGSGGGNTTLKSEVVYSTLSARRAAKEAARAKEQEKEDVKA